MIKLLRQQVLLDIDLKAIQRVGNGWNKDDFSNNIRHCNSSPPQDSTLSTNLVECSNKHKTNDFPVSTTRGLRYAPTNLTKYLTKTISLAAGIGFTP